MSKLQDPYYYNANDNYKEEYESDDSIEESPLVHKVQRFDRSSLGRLASANFSTDSIAEGDEQVLVNELDELDPPAPSNINSNERPLSMGWSPSSFRPVTKPRPKSTIIFGDEIESPIKTPGHYRASRKNIVPPPIMAPPNTSRSSSPTRSASPNRMNRHFRAKSPVRRGSSPTKSYQPFNFQSQEVANNNLLSVKPAHRKGHKYKHSSVSMNYFQEPEPISQTPVSDSYPIPTFRECIGSISSSQRFKVGWSVVHLVLSLLVFVIGNRINVSELGTLAHLIFYDSLGCLVITFVDVMSNFEVWNNSSIVYPYGLSRLEVLIGFSLGASLIMVGLDLLSHNFEEFILFVFQMEHEDAHSHHIHSSSIQPDSSLIYFLTLTATIAITLVTSNYILAAEKINKIIKGHSRGVSNIGFLDDGVIPKADQFEKFNKLANTVTKNPTYILTLAYTTFLIVSPIISDLVSKQFELDINELASLVISLLFCLTGWKLVQALGGILLLSYPTSELEYTKLKVSIMNEIAASDNFKNSFRINDFYLSKFNHEVFIVGIKLEMLGGSIDEESVIKHEMIKLIKSKLSRRQKNFKLEITVDVER